MTVVAYTEQSELIISLRLLLNKVKPLFVLCSPLRNVRSAVVNVRSAVVNVRSAVRNIKQKPVLT